MYMMQRSVKLFVWLTLIASLSFIAPLQADSDKSDSKNSESSKSKDKDKDKDKDKKDKDREDEDNKVTICHKGHTIEISVHALAAHLAHGDTVGACHITPTKNK